MPPRTASEAAWDSVASASPLRKSEPLKEEPVSQQPQKPASASKAERIVTVYSFDVPKRLVRALHDWLDGIGAAVQQFEGFISRELIVPSPSTDVPGDYFRATSILFFESQRCLEAWQTSPERAEWAAKAVNLGLFDGRDTNATGTGTGTPAVLARIHLEQPGTPARAMPPPKWKLSLLIWICVVTAVLISEGGGLSTALGRTHLDLAGSIFVSLLATTGLITFAFGPLLLELPPVEQWLKRPPPVVPIDDGRGLVGFARAVAAAAVAIANQGFSLFNPPPPAARDPLLLARMQTMERRLEWLRAHHHQKVKALAADISLRDIRIDQPRDLAKGESEVGGDGDGDEVFVDPDREVLRKLEEEAAESARSVHGGTMAGSLAVIVDVRPRWEAVEEYIELQEEVSRVMSGFEGFLSCTLLEPPPESTAEEPIFRVIFRFDNREHLAGWMFSRERVSLLRKLQKLLVAQDLSTANVSRYLPDNFTDLFVPQGEAAPARPPPKWKVWLLTTCSLWFVTYPTARYVSPELTSAGVENVYALLSITTIITVLLNSYVSAPIVTRFVDHWLARPRPHALVDANLLWRMLDQGPRATLTRAAITLAWFVGFGLSWALRS